MVKLCEPKIPGIYWFDCFTYKCKRCKSIFDVVVSNGDYIVKFEEINGSEVKWLPAYGKGGYLDLMTKLIPGYSLYDEITIAKATAFIKELNKHCEQGKTGNGFDLGSTRFECTNCNSKDIEYLSEKGLTNPDLSWLKISCDLVE
ncbi:MAG: hypothetical protein FWD39_04760 [Clostridiales bacterium]|nr:hypothetical protein [Clostridiales bacterium]